MIRWSQHDRAPTRCSRLMQPGARFAALGVLAALMHRLSALDARSARGSAWHPIHGLAGSSSLRRNA
jgi:hypothetical protein